MFMILPPTSALGVTLLLYILPEAEPAFNWDHLGGPPPESNEPIAYKTVSTLEPTPKWAKRIKEFLKKNRPQHAVEMLFPENATALAEQHKEIKRNMTKDPSWAWRKFSELMKLKGTTINQIPDHLQNFTFPDMGINDTYDCSKTDEKFNEYLDKVHLETDYGKLKKLYDPYDIENNKTIDWGHPTYDDEEFDQFVQERIGRLLLSLYDCLTTGCTDNTVREIVNQIDALTGDIVRILIENKRAGCNNIDIFKHHFLNNVLVVSDKLEKMKQISVNFSKIVNFLIQQFRGLHLNELETLLISLANNYANMFHQAFSSLFVVKKPHGRISEDIVQGLFANLLNQHQSLVKQLDGKDEINLANLDNIVNPIVETHYDHSFDNSNANFDKTKNQGVNELGIKKLEEVSMSEPKPKLVNQINNVVNIYINKPRSQRKKRRSIVIDTTTYLPPWDPKKEMFPTLNIPGISSESFDPLHSFFAKKHAAYDLHMKRKLGLPNNNSEDSFIFETFEYENPNKTRKSVIAQQVNIKKMRKQHENLRFQTRNNQSYQDAFMAKKRQGQQQKQQQMKQQQYTKRPEKHQQHIEHSDNIATKQRSKNEENREKDKGTTLSRGISIQDITNVEVWFEEAEKYYTRQFLEEQKKFKGVASTTTTKIPTDKNSLDESYERYRRMKEKRRRHKELSRRRYDSSFEESRSRKSSCEHCRRHRRRKHRKYHRSSRYSDYSESESSRRNKRRKRKYRQSSESSESRRHRYQSSESLEKLASSEIRERRYKHKRSYDETLDTTTTTTKSTTTKASTKRRSTRIDEAMEYAEDEPSEPISDVPSHELTSWHYWKEWSLFYFMHPNLSISDMNITTDNIWKTTWPWTTKKVRVTKWRHPNVSWPPMSDDDSRSSQDSYDWGSGQSWIQNQNREMKSVEHFVRENFFSEINEAASRLNKMNITISGNSEDQDLDLSANEDRMADFSARYKKDFREYKAKLKAQEREHQRWSLSGGNYSTTTEFDWEIKITKNYSQRSFRKGGKDIVFDISGMTLDPLSIEQIEKNLDADYLWKYGKNRTKTTTPPTTTSTTTVPTTSTSTTTMPTTTTTTTTTSTCTNSATSTAITVPSKMLETSDEKVTFFEEGKSLINSEFENMTSQEREDYANDVEKNFNRYHQVGHEMFDKPIHVEQRDNWNDMFDGQHRKKRNVVDNRAIKTKILIDQFLNDRMKVEDHYLNNKKSKKHLLHELLQISPSEIRKQELSLQAQLTDFLQGVQRPRYNSIRNCRRHFRRSRRGAAPPEIKPKVVERIPLNEKNFNQKADPEHPIFILTEEDLKNEYYKNYNASFINEKLHDLIDNMFEELKLNHDTSEEEKIANSIYHRKYLERRTTPFFNKLVQVIAGDNKRALEQFTYPPNYDFDAASVRDPEKEPYLMELKKSYERQHAKSIEELNRQIELAKQGKLNTAAWRREADEHVRNLPDDDD